MARQTVSTAQLHALLEEEFRGTRMADCVRECRMPMPIFCEPSGDDAPNWFVGSPRKCPHECHRYIWEAVSTIGSQYNIEPPKEQSARSDDALRKPQWGSTEG